MDYKIREIRTSEYPLLGDFLYEAVFIPEGTSPPDKSIVSLPELQVYIENFGQKKDDRCLVAEADGKIVGAVWVRVMNDYGHVDEKTPSLAISLYKEYRGHGIGTAMMKAMLLSLKKAAMSKFPSQSKKQTTPLECIRLWALKLSMKTMRNTSW